MTKQLPMSSPWWTVFNLEGVMGPLYDRAFSKNRADHCPIFEVNGAVFLYFMSFCIQRNDL